MQLYAERSGYCVFCLSVCLSVCLCVSLCVCLFAPKMNKTLLIRISWNLVRICVMVNRKTINFWRHLTLNLTLNAKHDDSAQICSPLRCSSATLNGLINHHRMCSRRCAIQIHVYLYLYLSSSSLASGGMPSTEYSGLRELEPFWTVVSTLPRWIGAKTV